MQGEAQLFGVHAHAPPPPGSFWLSFIFCTTPAHTKYHITNNNNNKTKTNRCYLGEATMHYYGPNRNTTFPDLFNRLTGVSPTGNPPNKALITVVKEFIAAARTSNITLRVSEANSVPDGGQSNLSNTIGAAIWTLVTALEFAQAGASGINFHWGSGGTPPSLANAPAYVGMQIGFRDASAASGAGPDATHAGLPYPVVRVPFYGYVLFSRAFGGNGPGIFLNFSSDAVVSECRELFFTYAILVPHAGLVSVVAANANPNITCDVTAALPGMVTTDATLQLLVGPRGDMAAYEGVSLAGQTYQGQGVCLFASCACADQRAQHLHAGTHERPPLLTSFVARCLQLYKVMHITLLCCLPVCLSDALLLTQRMAVCEAGSGRSASRHTSTTYAPQAGPSPSRRRQRHCCRSP